MFVHKAMFLAIVGQHHMRAEIPTDACDAICLGLPECANEPHAHNSYCKSDQDPPVCFGLYNTDNGYCFFPNNPSCDESSPVLCPTEESTTETPTTTIA